MIVPHLYNKSVRSSSWRSCIVRKQQWSRGLGTVRIETSPHKWLNSSRKVICSRNLESVSGVALLDGLEAQGITAVRCITMGKLKGCSNKRFYPHFHLTEATSICESCLSLLQGQCVRTQPSKLLQVPKIRALYSVVGVNRLAQSAETMFIKLPKHVYRMSKQSPILLTQRIVRYGNKKKKSSTSGHTRTFYTLMQNAGCTFFQRSNAAASVASKVLRMSAEAQTPGGIQSETQN